MLIRKWLAVMFATLISVVVLPFCTQAEAAESAPGITVKSGEPTEIDLSKTEGDVVITSDGLLACATVLKDLDSSIYSIRAFEGKKWFREAERLQTAPDYTFRDGVKVETSFNENGYRFTGTAKNKSLLIDPKTMTNRDVKLIFAGIDLTIDDVDYNFEYTCENPLTNTSITFKNRRYRAGFIVSHSNCVIELEKNTVNRMRGGDTSSETLEEGTGCILKNGEDGELRIRSSDGTDSAKLIIDSHKLHAFALGSQFGPVAVSPKNVTWRDIDPNDSVFVVDVQGASYNYGKQFSSSKFSFTNFYMESGYLECNTTGSHNAGIGLNCQGMARAGDDQARAYNLNFTGGVTKAVGGGSGPGIGAGGCGQLVDGIHISGGAKVYAQGGTNAPGIGSGALFDKIGGTVPYYAEFGGIEAFCENLYVVKNITIEGGTTYVKAIGDDGKTFNNPSPGIGVTTPSCLNEKTDEFELTDLKTSIDGCYATALKSTDGEKSIDPATGQKSDWQGYVKYGTDDENYAFSTANPVTPFKGEADVGKYLQSKNEEGENVYYTEVYFEPAHDHAALHKKENIQSNDYSCRTGGEGWTKDEIIDLLKVSGKDSDGNALTTFELEDETQLAALNASKKNCEVEGPDSNGAWPITFVYTDEKSGVTLRCTSYVWLRDAGTPSEETIPSIAANNLVTASGGDELTAEDLIGDGTWEEMPASKLKVVVQQGTGVNGQISDVTVDEQQLKALNEAKVKGETGTFPLTLKWTDPVTEKDLEVTSSISLINISLQKKAFVDSRFTQEYGENKASVSDTINYKIIVTNNSPYKIEDITLADGDCSVLIETLEAGETKEFTSGDDDFETVLLRKLSSEDAGKEIINTAKTSGGSAPDGTVIPSHESSVAVEVKETFIIKTSVENGTITESSTVERGESKLVEYAPEEGYHLESVVVDGEELEEDTSTDCLEFAHVAADHEVKVVYAIDKNEAVIEEEEDDDADSEDNEVSAVTTPTRTETNAAETQTTSAKKASLPSTGDGSALLIVVVSIVGFLAFTSLLKRRV